MVQPQLDDPPKWMTTGCPAIKELPERAPPQKDVEDMWNRDVLNYDECRKRYYALRNFYRKRDNALRNPPPQK